MQLAFWLRRFGRGGGAALGLGLVTAVVLFPSGCGPSFTSCEAHRSCARESGGTAGTGDGGAQSEAGADGARGGAAGQGPGGQSGESGGDATEGGAGASAGGTPSGAAGGEGAADSAGSPGFGGESGGQGSGGSWSGGRSSGGAGATEGGAGGDGGEAGSGGHRGDACSPNPCGSGTCALHVDSYLCTCPQAFTGNNCELPRFEGLGFLVGDTDSCAMDVSGDGRLVVGWSKINTGTTIIETPFTWSHLTGMAPVAKIQGRAVAMNSTGSVIVGSTSDHRAFRWSSTSGVIDLGVPAGNDRIAATATSEDGSVVVGTTSNSADHGIQTKIFRWTQSGGAVQLDDSIVSVVGISADGVTIVGSTSTAAILWTLAAGIVPLVAQDGSSVSATGMSPDASSIFGMGTFSDGIRILRWERRLSYAASSLVTPTFADTSLVPRIVDVSQTGGIPAGYSRAYVQGQHVGSALVTAAFKEVTVALAEFGISTDGWQLTHANAISADGTTIVGDGIDPTGHEQAWVARLR